MKGQANGEKSEAPSDRNEQKPSNAAHESTESLGNNARRLAFLQQLLEHSHSPESKRAPRSGGRSSRKESVDAIVSGSADGAFAAALELSAGLARGDMSAISATSTADASGRRVCDVCSCSSLPQLLLVCDRRDCGRAFHLHCLLPPLFAVPDGEWLCPLCQHRELISQLRAVLERYDREIEQRKRERSKRLARIDINLCNIIETKRHDRDPFNSLPIKGQTDDFSDSELSSDNSFVAQAAPKPSEEGAGVNGETPKKHYLRSDSEYELSAAEAHSDSEGSDAASGSGVDSAELELPAPSESGSSGSAEWLTKAERRRARTQRQHSSVSTGARGSRSRRRARRGGGGSSEEEYVSEGELEDLGFRQRKPKPRPQLSLDYAARPQRSTRARRPVNYKSEDFDRLIQDAIDAEDKELEIIEKMRLSQQQQGITAAAAVLSANVQQTAGIASTVDAASAAAESAVPPAIPGKASSQSLPSFDQLIC